jgi:hypothetical protein
VEASDSSTHEDDLACNASLAEQLVCVFCLSKWEPLRDHGLDLALFKEVEQGD